MADKYYNLGINFGQKNRTQTDKSICFNKEHIYGK